jgi:FAD/FMN-containing dehydrogenase/Fe-S oxidoreductase
MRTATHTRTAAPAQTPIAPGSPGRRRPQSLPTDVDGLARALRREVEGEVRFDTGSRALYAADASNYRQVPIGVVLPRHAEDVLATLAACRDFGAPILSRGGGTSLAGQCCNVAVVMDMSKYYNRVLEVDPQRKLARVQPGIVLDHLQAATLPHGLRFGPDPATHDHCTIGGMLGNDSCGIHSILAQFQGGGARTADNVHELDVVTYDGLRLRVGRTPDDTLEAIIRGGGRQGEIYAGLKRIRDRYADEIRRRYPKIPRRVSGYNLDDLLPENGFNVAAALVGSESTLVTILEATLTLVPDPAARSLLILGYPDVFSAGDHVPEILRYRPIGLEGIDQELISYMQRRGMHPKDVAILPDGGGWLFVEFGGESKDDTDGQARHLMDDLRRQPHPPSMKLFDDPVEEEKMWKVRESGLGATAFVPGMKLSWPGWEDSAVSPDKVGPYLRELRALFERYDYHAALYGHLGNGCIHCRIDFDLLTREGLEKFRSFMDQAADLVVRFGGSISGEHGDGQARAELLPKMYGPEIMRAFREYKTLWDPAWRMNPGKIVDPNPILSNLRLGTGYRPWQPATHFQFPEDQGSFAEAALRCVGVGKCRRSESGTMCPSYMATKEERDSTRGRAHALFEMLQGEVITDGWKSAEVKEALDLCLSCKGCKSDCPVNVDMATYKAEFLSHYYAGRLRPRTAYAMGLIHRWARLASVSPAVVNLLTHAPGLRAIAKLAAGVSQQREIPAFALETFQHWFSRHRPTHPAGPRVLLWPDTFNNYFHPEVARAAVEVLEDAGMRVVVPRGALCCGRPLYDYGMLPRAKALLRRVLTVLAEDIADGTPLIGLEPSCLAVFRDELVNLFPHDPAARRLSQQAFTLSEFLTRKVQAYTPPRLPRRAVVHGHCHHKAVMHFDPEWTLIQAMGLQARLLDSGCCGMAGSFGFEADKYAVSVQCGERVLLPAVREADSETVILADGFSCQEQIRQLTGRTALHLAEVLQLALRSGSRSQSSGRLAPFGMAYEPTPPEDQAQDAALLRQQGGKDNRERRGRPGPKSETSSPAHRGNGSGHGRNGHIGGTLAAVGAGFMAALIGGLLLQGEPMSHRLRPRPGGAQDG